MTSELPRAPGRLYILFDSDSWLAPLRQELDLAGVEYEGWNLVDCQLDLCIPPPEGVFLNRISASCHTRGHREAAELGRQVVLWLLAHGRRVLNGGAPAGAAVDFELSKMKQMQALSLAGLRVPESRALPVPLLSWPSESGEVSYAFPADPGCRPALEALRDALGRLAEAVEQLGGPVVLKPNCGGRGVGVTKIADAAACVKALRVARDGGALPEWVPGAWPVDGVLLVQRLIVPAEPAFITRIEIVGRKFGYAQKTDISDGATHLCTADGCSAKPRFSLRREVDEHAAITQQCLAFADQHGLDIAGFEFIEDATTAERFLYDINPNTNYSAEVQREAGKNLYAEVAALCRAELLQLASA